MKFKNLIKLIPFLSSLTLIIFLSIINQKEYTKLRILIWNTPSLTLGTYLAISNGAGFILSYLITTNLAKVNQTKKKETVKFNDDYKDENNKEYLESKTNLSYENNLIERDINDPSPTINAGFRIIGRKERYNTNYRSNNKIFQNDSSYDVDEQYDEPADESETIIQDKSISCDWNDESYSTW